MDVEVIHEDLGASITAEQQPAEGTVVARSNAAINTTWFISYHQYRDHVQFLEGLVAQYPNNSEVVYSGQSYQGNDILAIHIYGIAGKGVRPAIMFYGTVHAREWITTMVVEYFASMLLSGYDTDPEIRSFVDYYDFYLYPVANPDGFTYTQTNRFWRKNRQYNPESNCLGRDINRNWPYMWDTPGGASNDPCDDEFRGATAGDAPETQVLSKALHEIESQQGLKLFIDWHAYLQLFMTPYGYSCHHLAGDNGELQSIASGAVQAMASLHGTNYMSGPACSTSYEASGTSIDYIKDLVGGKYVFTVELRDTGRYGFLLPPAQILPTSQEAFEGVKYLLRHMK